MINIAQIGVGYWGPNLLRNLMSNKNCLVSIVSDISKERREYVQNLYPGVKVTDNVNDVFNDAKIDAVIISTPVNTHFDLAMKALSSGKHVLVEKPMAKSIEQIEQIEAIAKKNKLVAMVGHTFIYNSAVRYLKKLIDSNELGDIRYIYCQRLNLGRIRSDVDALWNFAPHDISIIQYLLNNTMPILIKRQGMDYVQEGIEDVVFMNIVYPNKIMANIHVSWLDPHKVRCITVVGTKKMVIYDDVADNKIIIYDKGIDKMAVLGQNMDYDNHTAYKFAHRDGDMIIPKINFEEPLKVEIQHFIDCIKNEATCITDTSHAMKVIRILSNQL